MRDDDIVDDKTISDIGLTTDEMAETPHPSLIALTGVDAGRVWRLEHGRNVLGRTTASDIVFNDDSVSRQHCEITVPPVGAPKLRDLGSTNGTRVNSDKIGAHERTLEDGDRVQLSGSVVVKFTWSHPLEERLQTSLYQSAVRDALTSLYNKRYLQDRLEQEFAYAQRQARPLTLVVFDLDHFKKVNDTFGHAAGDEVLRMVGRVAQKRIRREDVVARFGGEEFVLLMRETHPEVATSVAERIRLDVAARTVHHDGNAVKVTVSVGVACTLEPGIESSMELFVTADRRLYAAKEGGRNRVCASDPKSS